jgi:hypothetical protein
VRNSLNSNDCAERSFKIVIFAFILNDGLFRDDRESFDARRNDILDECTHFGNEYISPAGRSAKTGLDVRAIKSAKKVLSQRAR